MKFAIVVISFFLLSGCNPAAWNPYRETPRCSTTFWEPCSDYQPIPPLYLLTNCEAFIEMQECEGKKLNLCEVVELSLQNSMQARETWARTRVAAAKYGESLSPLYPSITAEGYYTAIREGSFFGSGSIFIDKFSEWGPYLSLKWLLFDSGATCAQAESMRQALLRSNWTHNREIQTVLQTAITDYYSFIASEEQVIASEANLNDAATTLDATHLKHELGIADLNDELQAETQVAKMELRYLISEQELVDDKTALIADLGVPANTPIGFEAPQNPIDLDRELPPMEYFIGEAYRYRPDLFASFANVLSEASNVQYNQRNQLFKLNLSSSTGSSFFQNGETDNYNYMVRFNLSLPLFKGFEYLNKIRQAKSQLVEAQAAMRQVEINMIKEVTTYYQNFMLATEKVRVNRHYVKVAEASFKASLSQYKAGTVDYTTLVNALTNLADARNSLATSKKDWYTSLTDLAYATGTLARCI